VDIPGADESNIDVSVEDNTLHIRAESKEENIEQSNGKILRQERRIGKFDRSVVLHDPVDINSMKTEYKDGVLTVTINKKA
jgi:HSP20 family protein